MIDEITPTAAVTPDTAAATASAAPHPAFSILAEIETVLRDLESIPAGIAAWLKAKLAEAKAKL